MDNSSIFFCNRDCEYFPCHDTAAPERFNCKFCYCPLYHSMECGGNFRILGNGVKDCSRCMIPHRPDAQYYILERMVEFRKRRLSRWYRLKMFFRRIFLY